MPAHSTCTSPKISLLAALTVLLGACLPEGSMDTKTGAEPASEQTEALSGTNLGGTNLAGTNLAGTNLSGTNLSGANLGGTNLSGTNLSGTNLGGTNLGGPNLAGNNLSGTNLGGANLSGANLSGANLSGTNLSGTNLSGTNLSGANLSGTNLSGTNLSGANLSAANIGQDIHVINDLGDSRVTSTGGWVKGASCPTCIQGNIAYARSAGSLTVSFIGNAATLVASKTPDAGIMRVKLDGTQVALVDLYGSSTARLDLYSTPVGLVNGAHTITLEWTGTKNAAATGTVVYFDALRFSRTGKMLRTGEDLFHADNKNGPTDNSCVVMGIGSTAFTRLVTANTGANMYGVMAKLPWGLTSSTVQLEAWEVLVWGSNTYCTFVVPAPVGTTYEGVRGFVKAIFRWNAPPSKSIALGAIGGGQPIATYTGMMNAAAKFADGTLSDNNLIATEMSFVSATTNNISVNVDFASWVMLKDGTQYVLGNPSVVDGITQYDEGYYISATEPDSTVGIYAAFDTYLLPDGNPLGIYNGALDQAWADYVAGRRAQPVPKRCTGAKYLLKKYAVPIPTGKCDSNLDYRADYFSISYGYQWSNAMGGITNSLTSSARRPLALFALRSINALGWSGMKPVLGGTHVFVNELPYN